MAGDDKSLERFTFFSSTGGGSDFCIIFAISKMEGADFLCLMLGSPL